MSDSISLIFEDLRNSETSEQMQAALNKAGQLDKAAQADFMKRLDTEFFPHQRTNGVAPGKIRYSHIHALYENDLGKGFHVLYVPSSPRSAPGSTPTP